MEGREKPEVINLDGDLVVKLEARLEKIRKLLQISEADLKAFLGMLQTAKDPETRARLEKKVAERKGQVEAYQRECAKGKILVNDFRLAKSGAEKVIKSLLGSSKEIPKA